MSLIGNADVAAAVQNRQPFETKARNLRGFTDVAGNYGVVSYGTTIALEVNGTLKFAKPSFKVYRKHLELIGGIE